MTDRKTSCDGCEYLTWQLCWKHALGFGFRQRDAHREKIRKMHQMYRKRHR